MNNDDLYFAPTEWKRLVLDLCEKQLKQGQIVESKVAAPEPVGKLMWKKKTTMSHDTRIHPENGNLTTEIVYKIPMVFDKVNPGPIQMSRIVTALESLMSESFANFYNIERCAIVVEGDSVYSIQASAIFLDHGPTRKTNK